MLDQDIRRYRHILENCKEIFSKKLLDYGPTWIILRPESLTDQILIKAKRIRRIEELKGKTRIQEDAKSEYQGIVNYCIIALMKIWYSERLPLVEDMHLLGSSNCIEINFNELYDAVIDRTSELLLNKNHDYDNAWKEMRISSITDMILVKLYRIKNLEDSEGLPIISENIDAQLSDIINYAIFALIRIEYGIKCEANE